MKILDKKMLMTMVGVSLVLTSCNDYLDKLPDSRLSLESPDDASKLLVGAYPSDHPAYLLEMYSDNTDCNIKTGWEAADRFQQQAYEWADITETGNYESPDVLWTTYYSAVTTANTVLQQIEAQPAQVQDTYSAQKGEALLCRAYAMFVLSTVFCQAYDENTATTDLGLPYPTKPETNVSEPYERGNLSDLYAKIEKDIEEGILLIDDAYEQPKFHFTTQSAAAFAARFYLYYHKYELAVSYATQALGTNPASYLRDWKTWNTLSLNGDVASNDYVKASNRANLFLQVTYSEWGAVGGPYTYGDKYAHNVVVSSAETLQSDGPWGNSGNQFNYTVFHTGVLSKYILRKLPYDFEYSDVTAGIGASHSEVCAFTGDETLLVRAEAEILLGQYEKALQDINLELSVLKKKGGELSLDDIRAYYQAVRYYTPMAPTVKKELHTNFSIDPSTEEPLLQCLLHLRRIVTIHDGLRMQDVKRYGMTIYRREVKNAKVVAVTDSMKVRDPRLAIQLPSDVVSAGLEPNPRSK